MIADAPKKYQRYLTMGDTKGNYDKRVDEKEAVTAAEEFCEEKSLKECRDFLNYLKEKGKYEKFPGLRQVLVGSFNHIDEIDRANKIKGWISSLAHKKPEVRERSAEYILAVFDSIEEKIDDNYKAGVLRQLARALGSADNRILKDELIKIAARIALPEEKFPAEMREILIDPLVKSLEDGDPALRAKAAAVLGEYLFSDISVQAKMKAFDPLLKKLDDGDPKVKLQAIKTLGRLSHPGVRGLVPAGAESFREVPEDKLTALAEKMISDLGTGFIAYRTMAYGMLSRLLRSKIPLKTKERFAHYFFHALKTDPSPQVRWGAAMSLQDMVKMPVSLKIKQKMIPAMMAALQDADLMVRGSAGSALADLAESNIPASSKVGMIAPLSRLLEAKKKPLRVYVTKVFYSLAKTKIPVSAKEQLAPYLLEALKDDNTMSQTYAAQGLKWVLLDLEAGPLKTRIEAEMRRK